MRFYPPIMYSAHWPVVTSYRPQPRYWPSTDKRFPYFVWKEFMRASGSLSRRWMRNIVRQDWAVHTISPEIDIVSFRLDQEIGGGGSGPCVSLYCHGWEVLRFDCFGEEQGHFHITPFTPWSLRSRRVEFRERTMEDQIERALFELEHNLEFYLSLNARWKVRRIRVNAQALARGCAQARIRLYEHVDKFSQYRRNQDLENSSDSWFLCGRLPGSASGKPTVRQCPGRERPEVPLFLRRFKRV